VNTSEITCRLVKIDLLVRLRQLGWWPWALLGLWAFASIGQEPRLLRSFGTSLGWQATWSGAAVVLAALMFLGARVPAPYLLLTVITALILTGAVGLIQAVVAFLVDLLCGGGAPWSEAGRSLLCFVLVWTPASLTLACSHPAVPQFSPVRLLQALPVVFSLTLAATCWHDGLSPGMVGAVFLAALGAILAAGPSKRSLAPGTPCA